MKKKRLLLLMLIMALLPLSSLNVCANDPSDIDLDVEVIDPNADQDPYNRNPITVPQISIDGYTLYFYTPCDGCVLRLSDENDNVVYSTVIPTGAATLILPSYLSGIYKIEIIQGFYCFWGYIEL